MNPTTTTLGGQTLYADSYPLLWRLLPGVYPEKQSFTVPASRFADFNGLRGKPLTLSVRAERGQASSEALDFKNLWLLEIQHSRQDEVDVLKLIVADSRWLWRGRTVNGFFNYIRRVNDDHIIENGDQVQVLGQSRSIDPNEAIEVPELKSASADVAPSVPIAPGVGARSDFTFQPRNIGAQFNAIPSYLYRPYTINPVTGKAWTALELAIGILTGYEVDTSQGRVKVPGILRAGESGIDVRDLKDNGYPVPRMAYAGSDCRGVLETLLRMARHRVFQDIDGKIKLFAADLSAPPKLPTGPALTTGPKLYQTDLKVERPSKLTLLFRLERETEYAVAEADSTIPADANRPLVIENCTKLPVAQAGIDLGDGRGARTFAAGCYVPNRVLFPLWNLTEDFVRKMYNRAFLNAYAARVIGPDYDPDNIPAYVEQRAAAVLEGYRRIYRVASDDIAKIINMEAESLVVLDPISGKRAPAPVWQDHALVINHKNLGSDSQARAELMWRNKGYAIRSGALSGSPADDEPPSPFRLTILDPELGVFQLDPIVDQEGWIQRVFVSKLDANDGLGPPSGILRFSAGDLTNASLADNHHMACRVACQYLDPNTIRQFHAIEVKPADIGAQEGLHPGYEVMIESETARKDITGRIINEQLLKYLAVAEAKVLYQSWQDRMAGSALWYGVRDVKPQGNCVSVTWALVDGEWTTMVDFTDPLVPRTAEQTLAESPAGRNLLFQRLKLPVPQ